MGFQTKTINVDVDVNENVKEDDNWNEKGNVDLTADETLNEEQNANGNAEKEEKDKICKDSILLNPSRSSSLKTELHPSQLHSEKTAFESEYYFNDDSNDDEFNENTGNCLGTIEDIKRRLSLQEPHEEERIDDTKGGESEMEKAVIKQVTREIETLIECEKGKKPKHLYFDAYQRAAKAIMSFVGCGYEDAKRQVREMIAALKE